MRVYSAKELKRIVELNGFSYVGCKGSHFKYKKGDATIVINKDINYMVQKRIIKENNLSLNV